jgi:hypothetical protein
MSTLRQKRKDPVSKEDIEDLISLDVNDPAVDVDDSAGSAPSSKRASHLVHHDPVFVARMVLRKVGQLLIKDDEESNAEDITTTGGIIALLKDIFIGIVVGLICVSALIFLDHKDVIHMQSAHNYRNYAFNVLSDPETMKNIEESSGVKFMDVQDYQKKIKEIESFTTKIAEFEEKGKKYVPDLEVAKKEYAAMKPEYDKLVADPLLGLDKFCGECGWQGRTNCNARLNYFETTHNLRTIAAKLAIMEQAPQCIKK